MDDTRFKFRIAPNAIEDLGSNLYTTFPRVLAEFVANAYDADAKKVTIKVDFKKLTAIRTAIRKNYETELAEAKSGQTVDPLAERKLPDAFAIEISDDGFGMSVDDVNERFLWTARRRRQLPPLDRENKLRPLMGRKGLGKLAGFGIARVMEVITKRADVAKAVRVVLDYDNLIGIESVTGEVPIPGEETDKWFSATESGTIIRLYRLGFEAVKSKQATIARELIEQFEFIDTKDFAIYLNEHRIPPAKPTFAFAWPEPAIDSNKLISQQLLTDHGTIKFDYRLRFRKDMKALPAAKRGVRVYSHNRMSSSPSLLAADTNMHGFRMTDYLDGIVQADFIDDQPQDYISTDRQSLRWETPLLAPLKEFLSTSIKEACKQYQKVRDDSKVNEVLSDDFTRGVLDRQPLGKRERKILEKLATSLARLSTKGVNDPKYRGLLPDVANTFGQGNLYTKLSELAEQSAPDTKELLIEVVRLNRIELDRSTAIVKSRLKAIGALKTEVERSSKPDEPRNESDIQKLFEEAPWLIDPHFHGFLTADKSLNTTFEVLADHFKQAHPEVSESLKVVARREPDLVFLLGDANFRTIVVVELKATTKVAEVDDIFQLREYMETVRSWLAANTKQPVIVIGELICTPPSKDATTRPHKRFLNERGRIKPGDDHRIRSYSDVLSETELAHSHLLEIAAAISKAEEEQQ